MTSRSPMRCAASSMAMSCWIAGSARRGRYPAVDVLRSLSRTVPGCLAPEERDLMLRARRILSLHAEMADLVRLGAYRTGTDPAVDEAIRLAPRIEAMLAQGKGESRDGGGGLRRPGRVGARWRVTPSPRWRGCAGWRRPRRSAGWPCRSGRKPRRPSARCGRRGAAGRACGGRGRLAALAAARPGGARPGGPGAGAGRHAAAGGPGGAGGMPRGGARGRAAAGPPGGRGAAAALRRAQALLDEAAQRGRPAE